MVKVNGVCCIESVYEQIQIQYYEIVIQYRVNDDLFKDNGIIKVVIYRIEN